MLMIFRLFRLCSRYTKNKSGAVGVEYAFLISLIAIVAATGMTALGGNLEGFLNTVGGGLGDASNNVPASPGGSGNGGNPGAGGPGSNAGAGGSGTGGSASGGGSGVSGGSSASGGGSGGSSASGGSTGGSVSGGSSGGSVSGGSGSGGSSASGGSAGGSSVGSASAGSSGGSASSGSSGGSVSAGSSGGSASAGSSGGNVSAAGSGGSASASGSAGTGGSGGSAGAGGSGASADAGGSGASAGAGGSGASAGAGGGSGGGSGGSGGGGSGNNPGPGGPANQPGANPESGDSVGGVQLANLSNLAYGPAPLAHAMEGPASMPVPEGDADAAPVVRIVNPSDASTVSGTVVVHIIASDLEDAAGTLTVEVSTDGGGTWNRADPVVGTLYIFSWATPAGAHGLNRRLVARAKDTAANATASAPVPVTVDNIGRGPIASAAK